MTELEMLEAEKYWCENCCNWDKENLLPDGYANCKVTGTLCFAQESGKECKCFNVPAENVIVLPCKVGDVVYVIRYAPISQRYYIKEIIAKVIISINEYFYLEDDGKKFMFGEKAFASKEEAEAKLKEGVQG
ncbi:MAG: hypothetical protein E7406_01735 [Ruminococcaceae bacterium]|nr:hypothetical protein [Oscillospiraceae bacterium]